MRDLKIIAISAILAWMAMTAIQGWVARVNDSIAADVMLRQMDVNAPPTFIIH